MKTTKDTTAQADFWKGRFGSEYIDRNRKFERNKAVEAWQRMLGSAGPIGSILECGSNIGRNLVALKELYPSSDLSLIEINRKAYQTAVRRIRPRHAFNGPILESSFPKKTFDLCFTCGVLIHIAPERLEENMRRLYDYSAKYILIAEYFSRKPEALVYHGQTNRLFKRDFGKFFMEKFKVSCLDYGFLWSQEYENAGFDDMTWWLFRKTKKTI